MTTSGDQPGADQDREALTGEDGRRHAEDEDPQRCEEALQGDRHRQGCAASRPTAATCSSTSPRPRTRRLSADVDVAPADAKKIKKLLGKCSDRVGLTPRPPSDLTQGARQWHA